MGGADPALATLPAAAVLARGPGMALLRGLEPQALPPGLLTQRVSLEDLFEALT